MIIMSWNINSIRKRIELLCDLAQKHQADLICLQETKVSDEFFPVEEIKNLGFKHLAYYGNKGYNGVAILSKLPLKILPYKSFITSDARDITVKVDVSDKIGEVEIHNLYIPAGGDVPDPEINPKFKAKLGFLEEFDLWCKNNVNTNKCRKIFLGDLNIAPLEKDVWSHKQLLKEVSHSEIEIHWMTNWYESNGLTDMPREFILPDQKLYSWWSYRNHDFRKSNRGRRLDHLFATQAIRPHIVKCYYDDMAREAESPSDHVPLIAELK